MPTPCLLIVDDDIAAIAVLHRALLHMGDIHFAKTGEDALLLARRLLPDVILLDAKMPGLDGFDVCRSLKAEAAFRHVPIVFVTRYSDPQYEMRALDLGAADFISKPYTAAVVQARVRNLLDLKRRTDEDMQAVRDQARQIGDARVAEIVGAASDAIVTFDGEENVVLFNAAACRMFGVRPEDAIGASVRALLGKDLSIEDSGSGGPARATMTHVGGERFPVEMSVSRISKGAERLTTVMLRDTRERERFEAESRSRIKAETANQTKTLMLSYIAHEMGNPLNTLLGFAQLLAADADTRPLPARQAQWLAYIVASGRHLQSLMRDVIDLGSFESGKLAVDLHSVDAARCAEDALANVSTLAAEAGVTLSFLPASPFVALTADANRLRQCLVNLLSNAVKYNRPGGWARIELSCDSTAVMIAVRDNGFGMDALQREHLFEPFNRLGRQHATAPGAGLGLVITRQLVETMSGRLHVASEVGSGSCFTITLPRATDTAPYRGPDG